MPTPHRHSTPIRLLAGPLIAASLIVWAAPALAQEVPAEVTTATAAVAHASNAFEYRDFTKVVEVLSPWVHPPRITDRALMITARRLLGISFHVLGDQASAKEEFGQLLMADPAHKLDPFVVPPKVIETFEAVRQSMKPALDRILAERGTKVDPDTGPKKLVVVAVPHPITTFAPFGIPQFVLDEPVGGAVFLSLQAAFLTANFASYFRAKAVDARSQEFQTFRFVQYAALFAFAATWAVSAYLANTSLAEHNRQLLAGPEKSASRSGAADQGPAISFGLLPTPGGVALSFSAALP